MDSHQRANLVFTALLPGIVCNDGSILLPTDSVGHHTPIAPLEIEGGDIENQVSAVTAQSSLENNEDDEKHTMQGDPTETCILSLAIRVKHSAREIKALTKMHRLDEIPFDSSIKYMATLNTVSILTAQALQQIVLSNRNLIKEADKPAIHIPGSFLCNELVAR